MLLVANIAPACGKVVERDAECAIAMLPPEARSRGESMRNRMRRASLDLTGQASDCDGGVEPRKQMNMVRCSPDSAGRTAEFDALGLDGPVKLIFDLDADHWPSVPR